MIDKIIVKDTIKSIDDVNISLSEMFYYLFWIIMLFAKGTGLYEGMRQYNICLVLAMFCLGLKLLFTKYKAADFAWMIPLILFGGWIYLHSKDQSAFILVAVMIGLKEIKLSRVFKIGALVWGGCFAYMILRTFAGGSTGPILAHDKLGLGPILRWSLGYTHPNVLHITYVVLAAFILYLWNIKPGRKQWKITMWLMLGNMYIFMYSVSFTGFLLMTLLLVFNLYLTSERKVRKIERIALQCILPVCVIFSLIGPMILDGNGYLFQIINHALNNRYSATRIYIQELGLSLWGIDVPSLYGFAIDCSYTEALLSYGCVFFVILVIGYMFTIHHMVQKGLWKELAIMLSLLVAGVSEPFLFNASFKNITVLFIGSYLFEVAEYSGKTNAIGFWEKEIFLFSKKDKEISLRVGRIRNICNEINVLICNNKGKLVSISLLAFLLFSVIGAGLVHRPDSIYIGVGSTDCGKREEKYLNMQELEEEFNSLVYEYPGKEKPMYEFSGNMVTIEYIRKIISCGVWGGGALTLLVFIGIMVVGYNCSRERKG